VSWQSTPTNFLFHHATLIRVYKAKLADELRAAGLYDLVDPIAWTKPFVVDVQAVGHGVPTLSESTAKSSYRTSPSTSCLRAFKRSGTTAG
jgi:hypothetical protein